MTKTTRDFLLIVAVLGILIASGSVSFYYLYFLPQQSLKQQEDINAIRSVIAPTPEQTANTERVLNNYIDCTLKATEKGSVWLDNKCSGKDIVEGMKCRSDAMSTAEYRSQFTCQVPPELNQYQGFF